MLTNFYRGLSKGFRKRAMAAVVVGMFGMLMSNLATSAVLEEIIVVAQKREQSANDVGITVNAFTADQLKNFGVTSAEGLESLTPGLTITNSQPAGVPVYTIRGVGFNDFTVSASGTVGLYVDGVSIPYPVMSRGVLFDIQRVEVLKGPQGDLYGRNTTAGQINFINNKPIDEFEAGMTLDYSRYETVDLEGYVTGALSDTVRSRLAFKSVSSNEGWQESYTRPGDTLGERDELAVRAQFEIDISEYVSLLLKLQRFESQGDNIAGMPIGGFVFPPSDAFVAAADFDNEDADWTPTARPKDDSETNSFSATLTWNIGELDLISITAYDEYERLSRFDTGGVPYSEADNLDDTAIEAFSQEVRLESFTDSGVYWTLGVFYSEDDVEDSFAHNASDSLGLTLDNRSSQESDSLAVFAHAEWDIDEQFRLTLGGRYTQEHREWTGCTYDTGDGLLTGFWNFVNTGATAAQVIPGSNPAANFPDPGAAAPGDCLTYNDLVGSPGFGTFMPYTDEVDTDQFMGKVTLDYLPNDDLLFYATVSSGFKSAGFTGAPSQYHTQLAPFGKENLLSYELGTKATLLENSMQLNASIFLYDYEDKQEIDTFVTPIIDIVGTVNVDESEVMGAEVDLAWVITDGLNLNLGAAYLDTEIKKFQSVCGSDALTLNAGCNGIPSTFGNERTFDASGAELDNAPEWQVSTSLSYTWPVTDALQMMVATDVSYKGDNVGALAAPDSGSLFLISDYTLVNARIGVSDIDGKWSVTLWGRNLTDEYYWHSSSQSNLSVIRLNGMPTTYGVTFSYNYY